jgi:peptidoglycan/LPS O-acetylase OafA/YrhL
MEEGSDRILIASELVDENVAIGRQASTTILNTEYRSEWDGLRAVAILAVVFYHAGLCRGGFVGVDVFFVLSGYLMTSIIIREIEKGEFTIMKFYERRIRRILPMLYTTIILCYYPAYRYLVEKEFMNFKNSAFLASIGLSNFLFAETTKGYFDTRTDFIPLVYTWTLGVEEQFYAIIPILFIALWRFGKQTVLSVLTTLALLSFFLTFSAMNQIHNCLHVAYKVLGVGHRLSDCVSTKTETVQ